MTAATRQIVPATRISTTRGSYMGEEGTGYNFGPCAQPGDFSAATRGHLQGSNSECQIELLCDGEIIDNGFEVVLIAAAGTRDREGFPVTWHLSAGEAIERGLARVAK